MIKLMQTNSYWHVLSDKDQTKYVRFFPTLVPGSSAKFYRVVVAFGCNPKEPFQDEGQRAEVYGMFTLEDATSVAEAFLEGKALDTSSPTATKEP